MSEDTLSFHFSSDKPTLKIKTMASKVVAVFERGGTKVEALSYDQEGDECFASFWPELRDDAGDIKEALGYLNGLSKKDVAYAKLWMDGTGEEFFYVLDGQHLVSFDDFEDLKQHRKLIGQSSVEDALFRHVGEGNTVLFVRLKFSKKRALTEYQKSAMKFIDEKSADSYASFKQLIDSNSYSPAKTDYPLTTVYREGEPLVPSKHGDLKLGEALTQCAAEKNFLYLVFEHEVKFGVTPCEEGKQTWGARNNILNDEGWQVLELLECLVLQEAIDRVTAKLHSPLPGSSAGLFSLEDGLECMPWWKGDPLPPKIWPS